MKTLFRHLAIVLAMAAFCATSITAQNVIDDSVKINGAMRHFKMILPDNLPAGAPLVVVCHGYGNPGKSKTWMNRAAVKHHFAVCVAQGLKDSKGKHSWNVGYPSQTGWKVDDVSAVCSLAKHVQKKYNLSAKNTFLTGMSNGGDLCHLMAHSKQNTFTAFASLSGQLMYDFYANRKIDHPVPFMEVHGTADKLSRWTGDMLNADGWGVYVPMPVAAAKIITANKCTDFAIDTIAVPDTTLHSRIIKMSFSNPDTHCDLWLYKVENGPHSWFEKYINTGEEVWKFFSRYLR
ncbi:MAG: alpha/beta hydrolase family esterase [Muribaculaceae bacterium]